MPHSFHWPLCCTFAVLAVVSSMAEAQLLPERLVPPQQFTLPPLPSIEQPRSRPLIGADKISPHLWKLPWGAFPGTPVTVPHEQWSADWRRPVLDVPPLATETDPVRPTFVLQRFSPTSHVSSPDLRQVPKLDRFPVFVEPAIRTADDPTAPSVHGLLTTSVPLAAVKPVPLLRLAIPDPFEQLRAIQLSNPPPDVDTPQASQERPPLPKLPSVAVPE